MKLPRNVSGTELVKTLKRLGYENGLWGQASKIAS